MKDSNEKLLLRIIELLEILPTRIASAILLQNERKEYFERLKRDGIKGLEDEIK
jgi:hypothetical protein